MTQGAAQQSGRQIGIMAAPCVASFSSLAYLSFLLSILMLAIAPLLPPCIAIAPPEASASTTGLPLLESTFGSLAAAGTMTVVALLRDSNCWANS